MGSLTVATSIFLKTREKIGMRGAVASGGASAIELFFGILAHQFMDAVAPGGCRRAG